MCDHAMMPPTCVAPMPPRSCTFSFPGRPEQVSQVRAFIAGFLDGHPAGDDAVLLVSELAANACAHSASGQPGGNFVIRIQVSDDGSVHAEVEDQGSTWDGSLGGIESPHGLFLVRALSTTCGTRRGPRGWVTWFVLGQQ